MLPANEATKNPPAEYAEGSVKPAIAGVWTYPSMQSLTPRLGWAVIAIRLS